MNSFDKGPHAESWINPPGQALAEDESSCPNVPDLGEIAMLQFALTRPAELSRQLRLDSGPDMQRRRWLVGLSFVGVGAGMIVSLFQTGMIRRLPDFPFWPFDATKVDAQPYAYSRLHTPDALLMVTSYALTALLAGAGGRNRAKTLPLLPLALAAKTGFDLFTALRLGREEWRDARALCGYCQTATVASAASLLLALPEALDAGRSWKRRR